MTLQDERAAAVAELIELAKTTVGKQLNRAGLDTVLQQLVKLASNTAYWSQADFPPAEEGELQARYMIHEEADNTYALYLNVMKPGKAIVPHDHTTWACIAGVQGLETNFLYQRTDDGSREGYAELKETGRLDVGPGTGIALMPDDIHAVRILDESGIRHLHFYGLALEKLSGRTGYNLSDNTCKKMSVGVQTRR
jgi:predicted metal-dependent enzyme (double-stranded beta helix superfamily)